MKSEDSIRGLSLGADDYLKNLLMWMNCFWSVIAILRRTKQEPAQNLQSATLTRNEQRTLLLTQGENHILRIGEYTLKMRTVIFCSPAKGECRVTPVTYALLYHLINDTSKSNLSPSLLLEEVWDHPGAAGSADLARVHSKNLRGAIEADPQNPVFIKTIKDYGYCITLEKLPQGTDKERKRKTK